jgi:integrase
MKNDYIPRPSRHATGQAVVRLCGKDHYLGRYGSAEANAAYERLIAEWLANGRTLPGTSPTEPTVNEVVLAFVRYAEGYYAASTKCGEVPSIKEACKVLRSLYGRTPSSGFGPKAMKLVRAKMVEKGWCSTYVNHQVNRLRRMFKWAVAEELVPASVHHGLQALTAIRRDEPGVRESEPVRPVPDAWVDAALPHMPLPVRAMAELQRLTGMRPGEVVLIRGCDLDTSGRVWVYRPTRHKTQHHGRGREVFIGPRAQEVLKPWLRADLAAYLFSPKGSEDDRNAVRRRTRWTPMTPSQAARRPAARRKRPRRERYDVNSYRQSVTRACDAADRAEVNRLARETGQVPVEERAVPRWHPNQLRQSFATTARREHGLEAAQVLLGHARADVTQVYAERDRESAAAVILKIG